LSIWEEAQRQASGAANKWSDEGAELVRRRLHALVRQGMALCWAPVLGFSV